VYTNTPPMYPVQIKSNFLLSLNKRKKCLTDTD